MANELVISPAPCVTPRPVMGDEHELVAAVRRGDDRAFEALYARYRKRIGAYVLGMVGDHGRAEDVTQEVFISALRRMRDTERPIAFKPWVYEIARNACIDHFRRSRRTKRCRSRPTTGSPTPIAARSRCPPRPISRSSASPARRPAWRVRRTLGEPSRISSCVSSRPLLQGDRRSHGHVTAGGREHPVPRPPRLTEEYDEAASAAAAASA